MGRLQDFFIASVLFAIFTLGLANFVGNVTTTYSVAAQNMTFVTHAQDVAEGINANLSTFNTRTESAQTEAGATQTGSIITTLWGILSITWSVGSYLVTPFGDFMTLIGVPAIIQQLLFGLLLGIIGWGLINAIKGGIES